MYESIRRFNVFLSQRAFSFAAARFQYHYNRCSGCFRRCATASGSDFSSHFSTKLGPGQEQRPSVRRWPATGRTTEVDNATPGWGAVESGVPSSFWTPKRPRKQGAYTLASDGTPTPHTPWVSKLRKWELEFQKIWYKVWNWKTFDVIAPEAIIWLLILCWKTTTAALAEFLFELGDTFRFSPIVAAVPSTPWHLQSCCAMYRAVAVHRALEAEIQMEWHCQFGTGSQACWEFGGLY